MWYHFYGEIAERINKQSRTFFGAESSMGYIEGYSEGLLRSGSTYRAES